MEILLTLDSIPSRCDCKRVPGPARGDSSMKPEIDKLGLNLFLIGCCISLYVIYSETPTQFNSIPLKARQDQKSIYDGFNVVRI